MANLTTTLPAVRRPRSLQRLLIRGLTILLAVILIGYMTVSAVVANVLTVPVRRGVTEVNGRWQYSTDPQASVGLAFQSVSFPARTDQLLINGWYIPGDQARPAIIMVHGKDGCRQCEFQRNALNVAKAMHERGFNLLMIDMRGHGDSTAAHFTFGLHERYDIQGAVDWLKTQGFQAGKIGVLGVSMGAASSIGATADEPAIGALVADSSYAAIYPILENEFAANSGLPNAFLPGALFMTRFVAGVNIGTSRPVDEISRIAPRPVLIIHGTGDKLIPATNADQLAAAATSEELWTIPGAGHGRAYAANPQVYVERVASFFDQALH